MSETCATTSGRDEPGRYEIRLVGHLDAEWADWFGGLILRNESDGSATLTGVVTDQAALHGLLRRVGELGITLIAVNALGDGAS